MDSQTTFLEIFERYRDPIFVFCYNILKHEEDAEEVAMRSFEKLWLQLDGIRDQEHLRNFLYEVSRHKCIDVIRLKKRQPKIVPIIDDELTDYCRDQHEKEIHFAELIATIYKEIEFLPEKTREVFILRYYAGKTVDEVAEITHTKRRTVYNQTQDALIKLREKLSPKLLNT